MYTRLFPFSCTYWAVCEFIFFSRRRVVAEESVFDSWQFLTAAGLYMDMMKTDLEALKTSMDMTLSYFDSSFFA